MQHRLKNGPQLCRQSPQWRIPVANNEMEDTRKWQNRSCSDTIQSPFRRQSRCRRRISYRRHHGMHQLLPPRRHVSCQMLPLRAVLWPITRHHPLMNGAVASCLRSAPSICRHAALKNDLQQWHTASKSTCAVRFQHPLLCAACHHSESLAEYNGCHSPRQHEAHTQA